MPAEHADGTRSARPRAPGRSLPERTGKSVRWNRTWSRTGSRQENGPSEACRSRRLPNRQGSRNPPSSEVRQACRNRLYRLNKPQFRARNCLTCRKLAGYSERRRPSPVAMRKDRGLTASPKGGVLPVYRRPNPGGRWREMLRDKSVPQGCFVATARWVRCNGWGAVRTGCREDWAPRARGFANTSPQGHSIRRSSPATEEIDVRRR